MIEQVWDWLVAHMPVNHDFEYDAVKVDADADVISASLSALRIKHQVLKVVRKNGHRFVYHLISLDRPTFGHANNSPRPTGTRSGPKHPILQRDFTTGRLSSGQPDMQRIPREHSMSPENIACLAGQEPREMPDIDFSSVEERMLGHLVNKDAINVADVLERFNIIAKEAPATMRRLAAAMEAVKIEILAGYTDEDLLNELLRRKK